MQIQTREKVNVNLDINTKMMIKKYLDGKKPKRIEKQMKKKIRVQ